MTMRPLAERFGPVVGIIRNAGPYVLLELLMPGGTLLALLLFYCRRPASLARMREVVQGSVERLARAWSEAVRAFGPRAIGAVWRAVTAEFRMACLRLRWTREAIIDARDRAPRGGTGAACALVQ